jgi:virulence-associated protein VapD
MALAAVTQGFGHNSSRIRRAGSMFAITFDLDTQTLEQTYGNPSWRNAYGEIRKTLADHSLDWQQGGVYFGNDKVDAVTCVLAVQDLTERYAWFQPSVRDIRMLRIEDNNDLMPAIAKAARRGAS